METDQKDQVTNKEEEKEPEKPESNEQTSDLKKVRRFITRKFLYNKTICLRRRK